MKLLVVAFLIACAFAEENYNGPEYQPYDVSSIIPVNEFPGFWEGRDIPKAYYTPNVRAPRIVGGTEVVPFSSPYMVALHVNFPFGVGICGGSILANRAIMTAAHCLVDSINTLVIAGVHNRHIIEASQQRRVVLPIRYVMHPLFNWRNFNSNIAILHLDVALMITPQTPQVATVRQPTQFANDLFVGDLARSLGWGRTANDGPTSNVLRQATNTVITNAACAATFGAAAVIDSTICVQTQGGTQGACHADEGGILSVVRVGGPPVQIGITSFFSVQGCVANHPIAFTRVTSFLGWIQTNINPPN